MEGGGCGRFDKRVIHGQRRLQPNASFFHEVIPNFIPAALLDIRAGYTGG